jgi:hypothetical protein
MNFEGVILRILGLNTNFGSYVNVIASLLIDCFQESDSEEF